MKILFSYHCDQCDKDFETLAERADEVKCPHCNAVARKLITTPAFTFANGKGTSGGTTMRRPGHSVPGAWR